MGVWSVANKVGQTQEFDGEYHHGSDAPHNRKYIDRLLHPIRPGSSHAPDAVASAD